MTGKTEMSNEPTACSAKIMLYLMDCAALIENILQCVYFVEIPHWFRFFARFQDSYQTLDEWKLIVILCLFLQQSANQLGTFFVTKLLTQQMSCTKTLGNHLLHLCVFSAIWRMGLFTSMCNFKDKFKRKYKYPAFDENVLA